MDIVLIGREDHFLAIVRKTDVLDLEIAGRQQCGRTALDGDRVQVLPALALPRKYDAIARRPEKLAIGDHGVKHAAGPGFSLPDLAACAIGYGRHADRPGLAGTPAASTASAACAATHGVADERDLLAIRRPGRLDIA